MKSSASIVRLDQRNWTLLSLLSLSPFCLFVSLSISSLLYHFSPTDVRNWPSGVTPNSLWVKSAQYTTQPPPRPHDAVLRRSRLCFQLWYPLLSSLDGLATAFRVRSLIERFCFRLYCVRNWEHCLFFISPANCAISSSLNVMILME